MAHPNMGNYVLPRSWGQNGKLCYHENMSTFRKEVVVLRVKRFWNTWSADIVTTFFWISPPNPHIENRSILDKKKELTHLSTQPQ